MSDWQERHFHRHPNPVPEGSNDFQRALGEILCESEIKHIGGVNGSNVTGENTFIYYDDDFEDIEDIDIGEEKNEKDNHDDDGDRSVGENMRKHRQFCEDEDNNNCRTQNGSTGCACSEDGNKILRAGGPLAVRDVQSPSSIRFVIVRNSLAYSETLETDASEQEISSLKLPKITSERSFFQASNMGASCSSKHYDRRDWHNVAGSDKGVLEPHGKRDRRVGQRQQQNQNTSDDAAPSVTTNTNTTTTTTTTDLLPLPSAVICTCAQKGGGSGELKSPATKGDNLDSSSPELCSPSMPKSPSGKIEKSTLSLPNGLSADRLSPVVDSSGHMRLSRVLGLGKARATAKCDVSPHRLLTRRTNSPNNRTISLDSPGYGYSPHDTRQRSHSWSTGKYNIKCNNVKTPTSTIRSPMLSPVGSSKPISTHASSNGTGLRLNLDLTKTQPQKLNKRIPMGTHIHEPSCPLYVKPRSSPVTVDVTEDLPPVSRRRAVSESHTVRPRRLLQRDRDSLDQATGHEHTHVHWADEEKGSALSTSVFLTSLRPRSYSHGATDGAPHRPILKKVAGF